MRRFILHQVALIGLVCLSIGAGAQKTNIQKAYVTAGAGAASRKGIMAEIGVQTVWKKDLVISAHLYGMSMDYNDVPKDYKPGTSFDLFPFNTGSASLPDQDLTVVSITAGKLYELGPQGWVTFEGGLSYTSGLRYEFQRQNTETILGFTTSNYSRTSKRESSAGLMLKSDIVWAFSSVIGTGAGVTVNFNDIQSPVSFEWKWMIGWMNRSPKKALPAVK